MDLKRKHNVVFGLVDGQNRGDKKNLIETNFINDDYYWIRSDNRDNKEVLNLLDKLNKNYDNNMKQYKNVVDVLYDEMKSYLVDDDESYPYKFYNTFYYLYNRYTKNKGHPIYYCSNNDTETLLLDINELSDGKTNCDVTNLTMSHNNKYLSYAVDYNGNELYSLVIKDLMTQEIINHNIPDLMYASYIWSPDNKHIYYVGHDSANRMDKLFLYNIDTKTNTMLYEEKDNLFSVSVYLSDNMKYILMNTGSSNTNEMYYIDIKNPMIMCIVKKRIVNILYEIDFMNNNTLLIKTNIDDSVNFKLMVSSINHTDIWKEYMSYNKDMYITDVFIKKNYIILSLRINGITQIGYIDKNNNDLILLEFDDTVYYVNYPSKYNLDYNLDTIIVTYESMIKPQRYIEFNLSTGIKTILKEKKVPNYDSNLYETKLIEAKSHDGKTIPISMCYRKDMFRNGDNKELLKIPQPLLLYGYGAYGYCVEPYFNYKWISLMDRSFICCNAHVRGGCEKGYGWYLDGKMQNKINTFKDFISCAEYLIDTGYTTPNRLIAEGRSAGGLLMGSILTMRPDLFNTIILGVPFVDVLVTMSDPTIPLTTPEWEEWGNPNIKEHFNWIKQYSPIDNIKRISYPNTYIQCGLHDPRVQYWEPVKFHLKLLDNLCDNNNHIIKIDMEKGHFSNTDRYRSVREYAAQYAFIMSTLINKTVCSRNTIYM
jgi:oligopeptidase B